MVDTKKNKVTKATTVEETSKSVGEPKIVKENPIPVSDKATTTKSKSTIVEQMPVPKKPKATLAKKATIAEKSETKKPIKEMATINLAKEKQIPKLAPEVIVSKSDEEVSGVKDNVEVADKEVSDLEEVATSEEKQSEASAECKEDEPEKVEGSDAEEDLEGCPVSKKQVPKSKPATKTKKAVLNRDTDMEVPTVTEKNASKKRKSSTAGEKTIGNLATSSKKAITPAAKKAKTSSPSGKAKEKGKKRRKITVERILEADKYAAKEIVSLLKEVDLWSSVTMAKPFVASIVREVIVNLPVDFADNKKKDYGKVRLRGRDVEITPKAINDYYGVESRHVNIDDQNWHKVAETITAGVRKRWNNMTLPQDGLPGALVTALILGVHEISHIIVAQKSDIKLGVPYFVPSWQIGSFGAITRIINIVPKREDLLKVAAAGPLAGFSLGLVLLLLGFFLPPSDGIGLVVDSSVFHESLLAGGIAKILLGDVLKEGTPISVNPLVIWAWAGLLINAINSIPAGELDGGRIAFSIWGRKAASRLTAASIALLGISSLFNDVAFYWVVLIFFLQRGPIAPLSEEITDPDQNNVALGIAVLVLGLLVCLPYPFSFSTEVMTSF
ncbi:unnamed protein product [Rhodiola kirilowii]